MVPGSVDLDGEGGGLQSGGDLGACLRGHHAVKAVSDGFGIERCVVVEGDAFALERVTAAVIRMRLFLQRLVQAAFAACNDFLHGAARAEGVAGFDTVE